MRNKCVETNKCGGTPIDLNCIIYKGDCLESLNICEGVNLIDILNELNTIINNLVYNELKGTTLRNRGDGAKIVVDDRVVNKDYEIRSVKKLDNSIKITTTKNLINIGVNEEWLHDYIERRLRINSPNNSIVGDIENGVITLDVNLNSDNESILISDVNNLSLNYNIFKTNTPTYLDIIKIDNELYFNIKIEEFSGNLIKSVGSGVKVYGGVDPLDSKNKIRSLKIKSDNLNVTTEVDEDDTIILSVNSIPEDPGMKYFYVSENYDGEEDGSIMRPYNTLRKALDAFVGVGTNASPEYKNRGVITLLSDISVDYKIDVNNIVLDSNGYVVFYIGSTNYFIDTEYLCNIVVGKFENGDLKEDVKLTFKELKLYGYNEGLINHISLETNNGKKTELIFEETTELKDFSYTKYQTLFTNVKDKNGDNAILYSDPVYKISGYNNIYPIVKSKGVLRNMEGSIFFGNLSIESWANTSLSLEDTVLNLDTLTTRRNDYVIPYDSLIDSRLPYGKSGFHVVEVKNSWVRILEVIDRGSPYSEILNDKRYSYKGSGLDSFFLVSDRDSSIDKRGELIVEYASIHGTMGRSFIKMSGNTNAIFYNSNLNNFESVISFVTEDSLGAKGFSSINVEYSSLKHVDGNTNTSLDSAFSIVNNYVYSTSPSFTSDIEAVASGLLVNSVYFNTTTNSLKRVV